MRISYADAPDRLARPPFFAGDLTILRTSAVTFGVTMALYGVLRLVTAGMASPTAEITQERFAKVVAPRMARPIPKSAEAKRKAEIAAEARRRKEKEAAESKTRAGEGGPARAAPTPRPRRP